MSKIDKMKEFQQNQKTSIEIIKSLQEQEAEKSDVKTSSSHNVTSERQDAISQFLDEAREQAQVKNDNIKSIGQEMKDMQPAKRLTIRIPIKLYKDLKRFQALYFEITDAQASLNKTIEYLIESGLPELFNYLKAVKDQSELS